MLSVGRRLIGIVADQSVPGTGTTAGTRGRRPRSCAAVAAIGQHGAHREARQRLDGGARQVLVPDHRRASGIPRVGQEPLQVSVDAVPLLRECGDVTRRLSTDPGEVVGGQHDPRTRTSSQCTLAEHAPDRAVGALSAAGEQAGQLDVQATVDLGLEQRRRSRSRPGGEVAVPREGRPGWPTPR